ncbi:HupE/UreJ family protein [Hydrogenimonas sp.]
MAAHGSDFLCYLRTITAFTLAHTITLKLALLNIIHLSSKAVEATIALSIIKMAAAYAIGITATVWFFGKSDRVV